MRGEGLLRESGVHMGLSVSCNAFFREKCSFFQSDGLINKAKSFKHALTRLSVDQIGI